MIHKRCFLRQSSETVALSLVEDIANRPLSSLALSALQILHQNNTAHSPTNTATSAHLIRIYVLLQLELHFSGVQPQSFFLLRFPALTANTTQMHSLSLLHVIQPSAHMLQTRFVIQMSTSSPLLSLRLRAMERHNSRRRAGSRGLSNLEEFLLADGAERVGVESNPCHFALHSTIKPRSRTHRRS